MLKLRLQILLACVLAILACRAATAQSGGELAVREETALRAAAEHVAPSVVQIRTIGGMDVVDGTVMADGPTTGLIISADGYILSSAFNFAQQPSSILITLPGGKQVPAELVATDHSRMFVLLKAVGVADLAVPEMAPLDEAKPGAWAVAVGRTFRADKPNITVGIVSATNRMFGRAIQTDADVSIANYGGPLVDIRGRVLGLIVPMAPQETSEVAGAEWYDSGIGFAVPLAPLKERIERMKKGEDQRTGLLGVGLKQANPHSAPAEIVVVRADGPAGRAGLKKGDRIVEVNGKPIHRQTDMRFALGTLYGGDEVRLVAKRGDERLEKTLILLGKMPPFRHAFLGILPRRGQSEASAAEAKPAVDDSTNQDATKPSADTKGDAKPAEAAATPAGVAVRMVYPGSPAAQAGIQPGDRIVQISETKVNSIAEALQAVNNLAVDTKVELQIVRGGNPSTLTLTTGQLPTSIPGELPPAAEVASAKSDNAPAGETAELKLPEFPHSCSVYVPGSKSDAQTLAAVLWLQTPANAKPADAIRDWQAICDRDGIVLVVPAPAKADHWKKTDLEYLHRLVERVTTQYKIDPRRVVVAGQGTAGAIAWPLALLSRDTIRGIATIAAPLPRQIKVPENDAARRLAVLAALPAKKEASAAIAAGLKKVAEAGYNVTTLTTNTAGQLSTNEREELARWIDTLDRF
jgi:serine protease Do